MKGNLSATFSRNASKSPHTTDDMADNQQVDPVLFYVRADKGRIWHIKPYGHTRALCGASSNGGWREQCLIAYARRGRKVCVTCNLKRQGLK